ncbi:MAG: hypothetical protein LBH72_01305, partial [Proteiniphilum sp.]|nr:hypothetical protein [Proteiniphilum sp.]
MKNRIENMNPVKNRDHASTLVCKAGGNIIKRAFSAMCLTCLSYGLYCQVSTVTASEIFETEQHVYQMQNLNPVVLGYAADASIFYDENSDYYYVFATNDGNSGKNTWPTQVWYSKDLINWEHRNVELP